jgi:RimJ/RimL family protein N-acetyltransferase
MSFTIRLATPADAPAFFEHTHRHFAESGRDGDPIFTPMEELGHWNKETMVPRWEKSWELPVTEAGWERTWLVESAGRVVGHADLKNSGLSTSLHRAVYGIGLERSARGHGLGRSLTQTLLDWAEAQPSLYWMELYVFANNAPALALYRKMGFAEIGRTPDLFRVHGQSIDDIHMAKRLRER